MRTNIVIDDRLMEKAMRAAGLTTKRAAVEAGLHLLIRGKAQSGIRRLRGKVEGEGDLAKMGAGRVRQASCSSSFQRSGSVIFGGPRLPHPCGLEGGTGGHGVV